jgi:hypothetical protein
MLKSRQYRLGLAVFLIATSAFATRWYSLSAYEVDWDEANRMSIAHSLNHGRTLYVDAWDHHTFLDILAFQQVFRLLPPQIAPKAIHLINILIVIAICFLIFNLALRLASSFAAALFSAFVASFLFSHEFFRSSNGELYHSLTSIVAFALYFLAERSRLKLIVIGLLLAAGFFIKQSAVFDIGAFLVIHWFCVRQNGRSVGDYARDLAWLGVGAAVVVLFSVTYFVWHRSLREALYGTFLDAFIYSTGGGFSDTLDRYEPTIKSEMSFLFHLHWLITAALVLACLCLFKRRLDPRASVLGQAAFVWLAFVLVGIMSIGRFYHHYFIQLITPLSLVCAYAVAVLPGKCRVWAVTAGFLLLYVHPILFPKINDFISKAEYDPGAITRVAAFLRTNTRPGETIFLYKNSALCLYFLSERFSPVKTFMESQMLSEHKDGPALLAEGLRRWKDNPPQFIVTGQLPYSIPEMDALLNQDYRLHTKIGVFQIYKRKNTDRTAGRDRVKAIKPVARHWTLDQGICVSAWLPTL